MLPERSEERSRLKPSNWLRWLGTLTFLGAALGFLVEGWTDDGTLRRELSWAAVTLGLTVLGILAARRLRDAAGARIFLGLAAATIPVHFAQAGASMWGYFVDGTTSQFALLCTCAALVLLAPPLALGVTALVRKRGLALTSLLFLLSSPLLIPSRDGNVAACLALGGLLVLVLLEVRVFRHDPALQTVEGMAARALLATPCAILLIRNAFYAPTAVWMAALLAAPSIVLLTLPRVSNVGRSVAQVLQVTGLCGLVGAVCWLGLDLRLLGLTLSLVALSGTRTTDLDARLLAFLGTMTFLITSLAAAIWPSPEYALLVVPAGTLHALVGYQRRSATNLVTSMVATIVGLTGHMIALVRLPTHDVWLLPAALGITLLVLASLFERYRPRLERLWLRISTHFEEPSS